MPYCVPSLASAEGRDRVLKLAPTMVKVMESGIFYEGGLKGAASPGGGLKYKIIPIRNLDQFIYELSYFLWLYEAGTNGWPSEFHVHTFSEAVRHLNSCFAPSNGA